MIFRVNFGFHNSSFGASAPIFRPSLADLGDSITQPNGQNKPSLVSGSLIRFASAK
jgi:hypothetical protein